VRYTTPQRQPLQGDFQVHDTLLGIPVEIVAVICFAIAAAYATYWPRPPRTATTPRTTWQHFVLRWFHALTWLCLGLASLALKFIGVTSAQILGLLGLAGYLIFMAVFMREKLRYPQG
jgi:hypothetical protein